MPALFSSPSAVQLHPVDPPVAFLPNFVHRDAVTLVLKEKIFSLSGDDFAITDANGVTVVRCEGRAFSLRDRKSITDVNHTPLFVLKNKLLSIHKTFIAEDPSGRELFRVVKHLAFGTKISAKFRNVVTGRQTELSLKGDAFGWQANIMLNDTVPIATISRDVFNRADIFWDKQSYLVTVSPGVDLALIAALCICFDEAKNE